MTKRDIYYRHPDLFVKQSVVDRYVDDLACTFGITRSQLNVTAAAKGLIAGNFTLNRENGHQVNAMNEKEGMLVPTIGENDTLDMASVHWILVIEKEATFRSLVNSPQWERLGSQGVILTAKGYPDINSRKFLRQLANHAPHIPMYAFVDLDPDGIAILSTYKYGSYRLAHEDVTSLDAPALSLPNIRWLGVRNEHLTHDAVLEDKKDTTSTPLHLQGLMKLTARDRTKAQRMLEWDLCAEDGPEQGWRQELQKMLMINVKAEMQILDELPGRLVSWLNNELGQAKAKPDIRAQEMDTELFHRDCSDDGMLF
jgi:meiotic recombination protein SPO11